MMLVLFYLLPFLMVVGADPDPTIVDYCKLSCTVKTVTYENTACKCLKSTRCVPLNQNWTLKLAERHSTLKIHNELRDRLASGTDSNMGFPAASNMNLLNYNIGLEYSAYCWASACNFSDDTCRSTAEFPFVGQNLHSAGGKLIRETSLRTYEKYIRENYYNQITKFPPAWIDSFVQPSANLVVGHFSQMCWALHTHLGCYYTVIHRTDIVGATWWMNTCNYAGEGQKMAGNTVGFPVYLKGTPCSKCPSNRPCSTDYPNLCGKLLPIPLDDWENLDPTRPKKSGTFGGANNLNAYSRSNGLWNFQVTFIILLTLM